MFDCDFVDRVALPTQGIADYASDGYQKGKSEYNVSFLHSTAMLPDKV